MARLDWDETSYCVSNQKLDTQHQEFIRLYNNLHETLMTGTPEEASEEKATTLKRLINYASQHFAAEEVFMKDVKFPELKKHIQLHQEFITKINGLQQDLTEGAIVLNTSLIKYLHNWIIYHIATEDKKYAQYVEDPP